MTHSLHRLKPLLVCASALIPLGGCGGGQTSPATVSPDTSRRAVTVRFGWPAGTRALSPSAQSVVVRVQDAAGFQDQRTLNRAPDGAAYGTAQFFALSDGAATVRAQAFADAEGTGQTLGEAGQTVTLNRGRTDEVTLSFSAPYTVLTLAPQTGAAPVTLLQGTTVQLVARGTLDDGTLVDPAPSGAFTTSSTGIATVTPSGLVTGVAPGAASLTFVDNLGRSASITVTVRGGDAEVTVQ